MMCLLTGKKVKKKNNRKNKIFFLWRVYGQIERD